MERPLGAGRLGLAPQSLGLLGGLRDGMGVSYVVDILAKESKFP